MSLFIGKTVWVISTNDIRYQGRLEDVSAAQGTIKLANARAYGTEDRRKGIDSVAPKAEILPSIVFSRSDVKSMDLLENTAQLQSENNVDEASKAQAPDAGNSRNRNKGNNTSSSSSRRGDLRNSNSSSGVNNRANNHRSHQPPLPPGTERESDAGTDANAVQFPAAGSNVDFLFSSAEQIAIVESERTKQITEAEVVKPKYDKNASFFDTLGGNPSYQSVQDQTGLNVETFGSAASSYQPRGRGRDSQARGSRQPSDGYLNRNRDGHRERQSQRVSGEQGADLSSRPTRSRAPRNGSNNSSNAMRAPGPEGSPNDEWVTIPSGRASRQKSTSTTDGELPDFSSMGTGGQRQTHDDQNRRGRSRGRGRGRGRSQPE